MAAPPRICVPIVSESQNFNEAGLLADLYEVRIDLIGRDWRKIASQLKKPWIACNRRVEEGGLWRDNEDKRIRELLSSLDLGAKYIDVELGSLELATIVPKIKGNAEVIISYHNLVDTPPVERLRRIVVNELDAGADICKIVTTANSVSDNIVMLELITFYPAVRMISFAMGMAGQISRVISPLVGGFLTWASSEEGSESAEGQLTVGDIKRIYRCLENK